MNVKAQGVKKEDDNADDDTATTKGFVAKDKIVRYCCVHLLTVMVAHLGEIESASRHRGRYHILRAALMERIHDKETRIRVQATVALSKLCGSEDPSDAEQGEQAIDVLLDTLGCDPAAYVPTVTLLNMPIAKHTLPCIVARSRDTDTIMRWCPPFTRARHFAEGACEIAGHLLH
ncbi:hypothetical protein JVT61DRAFT_4249 [Boletus reticuloceps]|uniref:Uncharacterized protein n=1 Tax=Boletus reticuloceps TaxID=495285 RepID=A0A8I2YKU0_9AGAM|nr:hypothetical protein JVT61DRAFT_4249 [Boletus reticuloceps]